jgi:voltage-gated potassium channel
MDPSAVTAIPLFASLSPEGAALVASEGVADVPAGTVVAQGGDMAEGMFVVVDGEVVMERGSVHHTMGPGSFFGELALLVDDAPRVARVRATTDTRLVALERDLFERLVETEPGFTRALLKELAVRLVEARTDH